MKDFINFVCRNKLKAKTYFAFYFLGSILFFYTRNSFATAIKKGLYK